MARNDREIVWIRTTAADVLSQIDPGNRQAIDMLRQLMVDDGEAVSYSEDQKMPKNVHVQREAIRVLGRFGAHARAALPALAERIEIGARAAQALDVVRARRQKAGGDDKYSLQHDDVALAKVKPLLHEVAARSSRNPARAALEFLDDPKSPDLREVPSFQRSDYPSAEQVLHDIATVGQAAQTAREQIDND
jgi:hypothetical protein